MITVFLLDDSVITSRL